VLWLTTDQTETALTCGVVTGCYWCATNVWARSRDETVTICMPPSHTDTVACCQSVNCFPRASVTWPTGHSSGHLSSGWPRVEVNRVRWTCGHSLPVEQFHQHHCLQCRPISSMHSVRVGVFRAEHEVITTTASKIVLDLPRAPIQDKWWWRGLAVVSRWSRST